MAEELSFGELEIQPDARPAINEQTPLRIAVLGDFSGRAGRGTLNDPPLGERKPIKVTFDNLEDRLGEFDLEFELPIFGGRAKIELEVGEIDDFHPDILHKNIEWFDDLKDLHDELRDDSSSAIEKVRDWAGQHDADLYQTLAQGGSSFQTVPAASDESGEPDELDGEAILSLFVGHHVAACPGDAGGEQLAAAVEQATADLMRAIMHDPGYRALESIWRGQAWFLKRMAKVKRSEVVLVDVAAAELAEDLRSSENLAETQLYKLLVTSVAEDPDPKPWGMVIAHYQFSMTTDHEQLLGRLAKIAAATGAPCLTGLDANVTRADFEVSEELDAAWQQLRSLPEAAYLAMCTSGFLVRPPIGDAYRSPERFKFEEFNGQANSCLFGHPALAAACLLATAFSKEGWGMKPGSERMLNEMPLHGFRNADDEDEQISTETRFTTTVGQRLVGHGITPLLAFRGQDLIEIANLRSASSGEDSLLAGPWQPGELGKPMDDDSGPPPAMGVATEAPEQPEVKPHKNDPEVDDDLAALMAAGGDDDDDDDDDDFSMDDDDDDSSSDDDDFGDLLGGGDDDDDMSSGDDDDDMDPELAALLGGGDDDDADSGDDDMDPELAALLGGGDDDSDSDDDMDPELAALLAGGDDDDADSDSGDDDMDPELAALLAGGDDDDDSGDSDSDDDMDPELAALLAGGDDDDADADSGSDDDEMDPELAALLAGGDNESDSDADSAGSSDDDSDDEMDPELAALLAGGDDDDGDDDSDSDSDDDSASDEDDELAALMAGGDDDADDSSDDDSSSDDEEIDDDLAALLAGGDDDDADSDSDSDDEEMDPELAALLAGDDDDDGDDDGGDADDSSDDDSGEMDDDLAALLAGGDDDSADEDADEDASDSGDSDWDTGDSGDSGEENQDEEDSYAVNEESMASDVAQDIPRLIEQAQQSTRYGQQGSPPVIDFVALLQPIDGDDPSGDSIPFDLRERLEESRKEVNPDLFDDDDPMRPEERVLADWSGIDELAQDILQNTSKNLLVGARLTEALTKLHGFAGLRDGLHLLRLMVDVCWDRLNPPLDEDDDLEIRATPFSWLDDPARGARFPSTVRMTPLLEAGEKTFSWQDWHQSQQEGSGGIDAFESAIYSADKRECHQRAADIKQCLLELQTLDSELNNKLGSEAPGFSALGPAIHESSTLMQQILQKVGPLDEEAPEEEAVDEEEVAADGEAPATAGAAAAPKAPRPKTRDDWYRQLSEAASALQKMEPHSPIPYLIQRAVELGSLPFPLLMKQLIRETSVLEEMNRELGIRQQEEEGESY